MEVPYEKIMKYDEIVADLSSPLSHVSRNVLVRCEFIGWTTQGGFRENILAQKSHRHNTAH